MAGIKLKALPTFPSQLVGGIALSVTKLNGVYTVDLNIAELQELASLPNPSTSYFVVYDATTQTFAKFSLPNLQAAPPQTSTVAQLPSAVGNRGLRRVVTDANATTFNSVVAGGGANTVPVFSDNAAWRIG